MRLLGLDKSEAPAPPAAPTDATPSPGTEPPVPAAHTDRPTLAPTATLPPNEVIAPVTLVPVGPPPWREGDRLRSLDPESVHNHLVSELDTLIREVRAKRSDTRDGDLRLIERLIQRVDRRQLDLPPFPDIARELDTLLRQPDTDLVQIARVVERDPGLIRRVWTCARSAMYNSPPRSLHHAVARVGLDTLWQIERLGAPALSPDGQRAVVTLTTPSMEASCMWVFTPAPHTRRPSAVRIRMKEMALACVPLPRAACR